MTQTTRLAPEDRYAHLHRQLERGQADDETWEQLAAVCIQLGKAGEAVQAVQRVRHGPVRGRLERSIAGRGWDLPATRDGDDDTAPRPVEAAERAPDVRERLQDAVAFLCEDRMPWVTIAATIAFPVTMGVSAAIAAVGGGSVVADLLALLPLLAVLAAVGALGRHVLLVTTRAPDDALDLPEPRQLLAAAPGSLRDLLVLGAASLGPVVALQLLGQTQLAVVLLLPVAWLLPMAAALRLATGDWRRLRPGSLWRAIVRSRGYTSLAGAIALTFAPATVTLLLTVGLPVYLVVTVVGSLAVAPLFGAARMLGLLLHETGVVREPAAAAPAAAAR